MTARALLSLVALALVVVPAAGAALPIESLSIEISDATVEDLTATGLTGAVSAARRSTLETVWVAYEVAGISRHGSLCCGHGACCEVEDPDGGLHIRSTPQDGPIVVLLRFAGGEIDRIRTVSQDCPIGFAGRRVLWAGPTPEGQSLELLADWIGSGHDKVSRGAVTAIAYHDDPGATARLASLSRAAGNDDLAKEAIFWLGAARREAGFEALRRLLGEDLPLERHKAAVFGLAQSPASGASDELARLGRGDQRPEIRRESLFWLGQTSDSGVGEVLYQAAVEDASIGVAKHAVFALSQLPEPESVEYLARLLEQTERPAVRREALFWIGQTDSEDALEIVARILND